MNRLLGFMWAVIAIALLFWASGCGPSLYSKSAPPPGRTAALDVHRALATLPERQREVTVLFYFLDLPVGEIARELEVTEGTVKTSLHRARVSLAAVLGEEFAAVGVDAGGDTEVHVEV